MNYKLGIDVGGTNTDFVLLNEKGQIVSSLKQLTTTRIEEGIVSGIQALRVIPSEVCIGSTHALNALLSAEGLLPTGLVRIAGNNPRLSLGAGIPKRLQAAFLVGGATISGGYECDGRAISPFCPDQLLQAVDALVVKGARGIALVSTFGCIYPEHEKKAEELIKRHYRDQIRVTTSSNFGGIGLVERENATLVNTALYSIVETGFSRLQEALTAIGIAPSSLFFVQNDGSQVTLENAKKMPILTLSCGPTNSGRGGALLANSDSCVVVDVGGTSTDVLRVENGYVKRSSGTVSIADVSLQFPAPDVVALAIGGGSVVDSQAINVGPKSVGSRLFEKAQSFGGNVLTLTDVALALDLIEIEGATPCHVQRSVAQGILEKVVKRIGDAVTLVRGEKRDLPCVLVGGGAPIIQKGLEKYIHGVCSFDNSHTYGIANAYGAIHSEISGQSDQIVSLTRRDEVIPDLIRQAKESAVAKGADSDCLRVGNVAITPFAYSKEKLARISIAVAGPKKQN